MDKHSSGTWYIQQHTDNSINIIRYKTQSTETLFIAIPTSYREARANAERVVLCVNAMDGIDDPQKLRDAWEVCKELELDQAQKYKEQRDELLKALRKIANQSEDEGRIGCTYGDT